MSLNTALFNSFSRQILKNVSFRTISTSIGKNAEPAPESAPDSTEEDGFRTLELRKKRNERKPRRQFESKPVLPPRYKKQKIDQDWGNVWPAARSFHPATVPLPLRQGYPATSGEVSPDKWGNAELMKIHNFLHLTPPVISRQCEALKKFCTAWPKGLENANKQEKHFPVTISKRTYLHSSPTVRDIRARAVTLKVSLKSLDLDDHSRDKLLRLVGERYNSATDVLTIYADRCPITQQNYDYCRYLLTVVYSESKKTEPWEHEKEVVDREYYIWEGSPSQESLKTYIEAKEEETPKELIEDYVQATLDLHNEGEDITTVSKYGDSVLKVVGLA